MKAVSIATDNCYNWKVSQKIEQQPFTNGLCNSKEAATTYNRCISAFATLRNDEMGILIKQPSLRFPTLVKSDLCSGAVDSVVWGERRGN